MGGQLTAIRPPGPRRRSAICVGAGRTSSRTSSGHTSVWGRCCCVTARCGGGGSAWTLKHEAWLSARRFDDTAMTATFAHYRATVDARVRQLAAIDADLAACYDP